MKTKILLALTINLISCKAQVYSLNDDYEDKPNNSYFKDMNNELQQYVGTYNASYNGNQITLFITKEEHKYFELYTKKYYQDVISIKYIVKNSSGIILQNTQNMHFQPNQIRHTIYSISTRPSQNAVVLDYGGTNCSVGNGKIILKKINSTQISWEYRPNDIIVDDSRCPPGTDTKIYLPETKDLIFTKQYNKTCLS